MDGFNKPKKERNNLDTHTSNLGTCQGGNSCASLYIIWAMKFNCWSVWKCTLLVYRDALFLTEAYSLALFPRFFFIFAIGPSSLLFFFFFFFFLGRVRWGAGLPKVQMTLVASITFRQYASLCGIPCAWLHWLHGYAAWLQDTKSFSAKQHNPTTV